MAEEINEISIDDLIGAKEGTQETSEEVVDQEVVDNEQTEEVVEEEVTEAEDQVEDQVEEEVVEETQEEEVEEVTPIQRMDEVEEQVEETETQETPDAFSLTDYEIEIGEQTMSLDEVVNKYVELQNQEQPEDPYKDDEFIQNFLKVYANGGKAEVSKYLELNTKDYSNRSDMDIIRDDFMSQNSDLPSKAAERLFEKKLESLGYVADGEYESDEDKQVADALIKREANTIRSKFEEQKNAFQIPEREENTSDPIAEQKAQLEQQLNAWNERVDKDPTVSSFKEKPLVEIHSSEGERFGFEVENVDNVVEMTKNNDLFFQQFDDGKGSVDMSRWIKVATYSQDPDGFEKALIEHGRNLEKAAQLKEAKNIDGDIRSNANEASSEESFLDAALKQKGVS